MKASTLLDWLNSQIEIVCSVCGSESAANLRRLSDVIGTRKDATVAEVCRALNNAASCDDGEVSVEPVAELLDLMVVGACKFAKKADADELRRFSAILNGRKRESFDSFVRQALIALTPRPRQPKPVTPPLGDGDLQIYLRRLNDALGDAPRFEAIYQEISRDARLKAPETKKLAKAFSGKTGRSKVDALGLIYGRHKSVMAAEPKGTRTGNRLAG